MQAYLVKQNVTMTAKMKGGATRSNDTVGLYPSVALRVGKYALKDSDTTIAFTAIANHHTFQSVTAR